MKKEKLFVFFAKSKGVKVSDIINYSQVNDSIINNLGGFKVNFTSGKRLGQPVNKVKAIPVDDKGKVLLKKLGLGGMVNRNFSFDYTLGDSLMFYVQLPDNGDYESCAYLFDSIGKSLGLKAFDSFRGEGIYISSKKKVYKTT